MLRGIATSLDKMRREISQDLVVLSPSFFTDGDAEHVSECNGQLVIYRASLFLLRFGGSPGSHAWLSLGSSVRPRRRLLPGPRGSAP